ncbi:At5g01610-like protein [Dioscorea alata]|uniref:At5g01610-like protein n=1 Tax=Dioscorea alata TaxID=55571 RepID=A0ACB7WBR2_DIOAL|nr:At5g01610-like protein [Dioscorea alata]
MPAASRFFFAFILLSSLRLAFSDAPSAYEMLEKFDFPRGILPEGVVSYTLRSNGGFEVRLSSDCEFKVNGGYLLRYKRRITGRVERGSIVELTGVSVKVLVWFNINRLVKGDAEIYFYVGPLSASFPTSNFEECPKCRCGFDCASALLLDS